MRLNPTSAPSWPLQATLTTCLGGTQGSGQAGWAGHGALGGLVRGCTGGGKKTPIGNAVAAGGMEEKFGW